MATIDLVPKIRFPDFNQQWIVLNLDQICSKIGDGLHGTPVYDDEGEYFFVNGNNFSNGRIILSQATKKVNKDEFLKHGKKLTDRTIFISINGTIGNLAFYNNEPILLGKSAAYINILPNYQLEYIYNYLSTRKVRAYFFSELTGSTIKNLSLKTIRGTKVAIPKSSSEQQKIATFLTAIDQRIQLLEMKKAKLEEYKKGVMQKLFSQEIRFKDDDGKEFPDWEEKRLGDVITLEMGQSPKSTSYNIDSVGTPLIQGNADIENRISKPRQHTSEPIKFCFENDILMTVRAPVGFIAKCNQKGSIGRGVCAIRNKENSDMEFLYQFLLWLEPNWNRIGQGSTFSAISSKDIKTLNITLPSTSEQKIIGEFLKSLDSSIASLSLEIDYSKKYKKGLLQKMFV